MAKLGGIKEGNKFLKMGAIIVILLILIAVVYGYMYNHFTTEQLAKFALIKFILN